MGKIIKLKNDVYLDNSEDITNKIEFNGTTISGTECWVYGSSSVNAGTIRGTSEVGTAAKAIPGDEAPEWEYFKVVVLN